MSPESEGTAVIALVPSWGRGGGIESYAAATLAALEQHASEVIVMALQDQDHPPSLRDKWVFAARVLREARRKRGLGRVIIAFHPAFTRLVHLAWLASGRTARVYVVVHAIDLVRSPRPPKRGVRLVAVSTFTAGMLARFGNASVLHAGIPRSRYLRLVEGSRRTTVDAPHRVLTVFSLSMFEDKGGPCIIEACEELRAHGGAQRLTFAGKGPASEALLAASRSRDWIEVMESLSDPELDAQYDEADVFVLATRSRYREGDTGEGLGLVLVEAALAGLPVVAPAFGGSADAFLEGITGMRPNDESPGALAHVLAWAYDNPEALARMGKNGRTWAGAAFSPETHAAAALSIFLEDEAPIAAWELEIRGERG